MDDQMTAIKDPSGKPRPKVGGARPGAGRKPAPPVFAAANIPDEARGDPEAYLRSVIADDTIDVKLRVEASKVLLTAQTRVAAEKGKKEQQLEVAKQVAAGKFAPKGPPKLVVNN